MNDKIYYTSPRMEVFEISGDRSLLNENTNDGQTQQYEEGIWQP